MSYSICEMPSLSCLLSFYTIPISLFFNSKNFLFSSICMCNRDWFFNNMYNRERGGKVFLYVCLIERERWQGFSMCMYNREGERFPLTVDTDVLQLSSG